MITFTADGKDYKLEVTPATLKQMEKAGVNFAQLGEKLLAAETLWKGLLSPITTQFPIRSAWRFTTRFR